MDKTHLIKLVFTMLSVSMANIAQCQVRENDPSTWPKPSMENSSKNGFYDSKEKLLSYYKWLEKYRAENLPNLYLLKEDKAEVEKQFKPDFYLEKLAKKEKHLALDSIKGISIATLKDLEQYSATSSNPCEIFHELFYEIVFIEVDSVKNEIKLSPYLCSSNDPLAHDELTDYELIKKGDTLEIKLKDD